MNSYIESKLKRFDINNDGKIDVADAHAVITAELAKSDPLRVGIFAFVVGVLVTVAAFLGLR